MAADVPNKPRKKPISPQAMTVYNTIAAAKYSLTARQIARQLDVSTNTVHRAIDCLQYFGLIAATTKIHGFKNANSYVCVSYTQTKRRYLEQMASEFDGWFAPSIQAAYVNRAYKRSSDDIL